MIWLRLPTVAVLAALVLLPVGLVVYQSFLDEPFFVPAARLTLSSYRFVLGDPDFARAFLTTLALAAGMTAIAVPLGGVLAFLVVRTDLPGKRLIEPALLVPIVLSPIVIAFGYVVAIGPVGFASLAFKDLIGFVPWNLYSFTSLVIIAGLTHVPHVYLFSSTSLRKLNLELEEQARSMGAPPWRVALTVSLPLAAPALVHSGVLIFFLGFELFGLPLVIGDPANVLVLTTYLFKLTNILGTPSYQLMAVVVVAIALVTLPLVYLQRYLLAMAERYVTMGGKGFQARPLRLGRWRWAALGGLVDYLVLLPRALPGLVAGLAFLWVFLFVPYLGMLRSSLVGLWLAYSVVWLAFGLRLISAALSQIAPELEEAARVAGASPGRTLRDVTLPLLRFGLVSSWLLCFMIFVREYSTGVYLQGPGTEVLGPLIVTLFGGGSLELVAALSVVNVGLVAVGLALALRFGVRI